MAHSVCSIVSLLLLGFLLAWGQSSLAQVKGSTSVLESVLAPADLDIKPIELKVSLLKTENYPVELTIVLKLVEEQNLTIAQSRKNTEVLQSRLRQ